MILGRWVSVHRRFEETWCLCWRWRFLGHPDSRNPSKKYSKIFWILKMDAFCYFEKFGTSYPVTRVRRCENPKPCVTSACLWQGYKRCAAGRTLPASPRGSLISECHTLSGTNIDVNSFTVLRSSSHSTDMCIGVSYAEFHGNREKNVGSTDRQAIMGLLTI